MKLECILKSTKNQVKFVKEKTYKYKLRKIIVNQNNFEIKKVINGKTILEKFF